MNCPECNSDMIDVYDTDRGDLDEIWYCACLNCDYEFKAKLRVVEIDTQPIKNYYD